MSTTVKTKIFLKLTLVATIIIGVGFFYLFSNSNLDNWSYERVNDPTAVIQTPQTDTYTFLLNPKMAQLNQGWRQELSAPIRYYNNDTIEFENWLKAPEVTSGWPASVTVFQWHESMPKGLKHLRPPLSHRIRKGQLNDQRKDQLVVTLWNDSLIEKKGLEGDGDILGALTLKTGLWYQFKYEIFFHPTQGYVFAQYRVCPSIEICKNNSKDFPFIEWIHYQNGLGYEVATDYYFKFGAYTTLPFSDEVKIVQNMSTKNIKSRSK